ncbi:hypothetical protein OG216_00850 [Streptomycetaceae bacterium NBC_01309]
MLSIGEFAGHSTRRDAGRGMTDEDRWFRRSMAMRVPDEQETFGVGLGRSDVQRRHDFTGVGSRFSVML